jgi:hypothetical protein
MVSATIRRRRGCPRGPLLAASGSRSSADDEDDDDTEAEDEEGDEDEDLKKTTRWGRVAQAMKRRSQRGWSQAVSSSVTTAVSTSTSRPSHSATSIFFVCFFNQK